MDLDTELKRILRNALHLNGQSVNFTANTQLLGAIPELDSMAVVTVITALEEHFGFQIDDDEIDGAVFATFGTLQEFVRGKLAA